MVVILMQMIYYCVEMNAYLKSLIKYLHQINQIIIMMQQRHLLLSHQYIRLVIYVPMLETRILLEPLKHVHMLLVLYIFVKLPLHWEQITPIHLLVGRKKQVSQRMESHFILIGLLVKSSSLKYNAVNTQVVQEIITY